MTDCQKDTLKGICREGYVDVESDVCFTRIKYIVKALYGYKTYEAKNRSFNNRKSFEINF